MQLYNEMEEYEAIPYLSKAADLGSAEAALFCGSACFNQGYGNEAFKYFTIAYRLGVPSAGWHLALCYIGGTGTKKNKEKAIEVMRHAANMDYPEAVYEMYNLEPDNEIWQQKLDSLNLQFDDFPIILNEE